MMTGGKRGGELEKGPSKNSTHDWSKGKSNFAAKKVTKTKRGKLLGVIGEKRRLNKKTGWGSCKKKKKIAIGDLSHGLGTTKRVAGSVWEKCERAKKGLPDAGVRAGHNYRERRRTTIVRGYTKRERTARQDSKSGGLETI